MRLELELLLRDHSPACFPIRHMISLHLFLFVTDLASMIVDTACYLIIILIMKSGKEKKKKKEIELPNQEKKS